MRKLAWFSALVLLAFAAGATGVPGPAAAAAADWLVDSGRVDSGRVELAGPRGAVVPDAI